MGEAKKNRRECPVVGHVISSRECGENRGSHYACPATCPHNPWAPANYDRALQIDDSLTARMFRRLGDEERAGATIDSLLKEARSGAEIERQCLFVRKFHRDRDAAGRTFVERWAAQRWEGLDNDERFLLGCQTRIRVGLLEVQRVINDHQCEVIDLLDASRARLLVQDRSLAAMAVRFARLLGWIVPLPHYYRVHGVALTIPETGGLEADEVVREVARHLGGPTEEGPLREWLSENLPRVDDSFHAIQDAFRWQMFKNLDARYSKAMYRFRGSSKEILRRLDEVPSVALSEPSEKDQADGFFSERDWFDESAPLEEGQTPLPLASIQPAIAGRLVLGRVLVAEDRVRIEANNAARYQALRAQFEKRLGRLVEFTAERVDDLGAQTLGKTKPPDLTLVPPRLLEHAPRIVLASSRLATGPSISSLADAERAMWREQQEKFLNDAIPALDGRTPRQAATDPSLRPKLVRLMKGHVRQHDERNLRTGQQEDINWMLRELGLTEILFDPPPPRPVPPSLRESEVDDVMEDADLPPPPPLPAEPFTEKEIARRFEDMDTEFPDEDDLMDTFEDEAPEVYDALDAAAPHDGPEHEWWALLSLAARAWFVFFPSGHRPGHFDANRFRASLAAETEVLLKMVRAKDPRSLEPYLDSGRQPALSRVLSLSVLSAVTEGPKELRLRPEAVPILLVLLRAYVDELDAAAHE